MTSTVQITNALSLHAEVEMHDVHMMSGGYMAPDPKWRHVDEAGHVHRYNDELEVPTLGWVKTGTEWVGDDYDAEEYDIGEWRCRRCGELVEPGRAWRHSPDRVAGLMHMWIECHGVQIPLTEDQMWRVRWIGRDTEHLERYLISLLPEGFPHSLPPGYLI